VIRETPSAATLVLGVDGWPGHRAGQHLDVRLTAEDGYTAQRSYSIATPPEEAVPAITVERLDDGEVSPYLVDEARAGDMLEVRGPVGGWFVWDTARGGPLWLIGGGSGVVPLMAMLRHRAAARSAVKATLLYSSRRLTEVIYREELERLAAGGDGLRVVKTLTREQPPGWTGLARRIDRTMLEDVGFAARERPQAFICGPAGLVELAGQLLVELGHEPELVKTERFGPSGS
jgi:ferredoxin-NADP reductase